MTPQEKRQAKRVIRNAMQPERRFFDLVGELQLAVQHDAEEYDWQSAIDHLHAIEDSLPLLFELVHNIQRAMKGAPTP